VLIEVSLIARAFDQVLSFFLKVRLREDPAIPQTDDLEKLRLSSAILCRQSEAARNELRAAFLAVAGSKK